jgi:hypothetical protein
MSPSPAIERARQINRTWTVRGNLAEDTDRYLDRLDLLRPATLREVCELAVAAARQASAECRDPKPDFYAALFCRATPEEREEFLRDHLWTRELSALFAAQRPSGQDAPHEP